MLRFFKNTVQLNIWMYKLILYTKYILLYMLNLVMEEFEFENIRVQEQFKNQAEKV